MGLNQAGLLQLPLLLALAVTAAASGGTWAILRNWRQLTQTQLRLDRCTGEAALQLKDVLISIERSNSRIRGLRTAIAAAQAIPTPQSQAAAQSMKIVIQGLVVTQETQRARWLAAQGKWFLGPHCRLSQGDLLPPLPTLNWTRPMQDLLGGQPLVWAGPMPTQFLIQAKHPPRNSAASVTRLKGGPGAENESWTAQWTAPRL